MTKENSKNASPLPAETAADGQEETREAGIVDETTSAPAPKMAEAEEKARKTEPDTSALELAMKDQAREDEKPQSSSFSLRKILGGDWLTAELLRRQIGVILLITGFGIVYISNRYSCQKDMLEIDRLNTVLVDAKYKALSSASELTEKCRESNVLQMLSNNKDSVLKSANQPPYIISVPQQHQPVK